MTARPKNRNIYIIGAQCTGKTTLVSALSDYFTTRSKTDTPPSPSPPYIIREVARSVLKEHGFTAADIRDSPQSALDLQRLILQAQAGAEAAALREHQWFISDRSGLDPLIYAHTYVGQEAVARMMEGKDWEVCLRTLRDSLVVVCEPSASWLHDDGTRLMPIDDEEWYQLHTTFCRFLERLGLTYTVVSKEMVNIKERVGLVLDKFLQ